MSANINTEEILKNQKLMDEHIQEQSVQIKQLTGLVQSLLNIVEIQPKQINLAVLVNETGKCRQTIRAHLLSKYEPEKDFYIKNGSILIDSNIVPLIKEHYAKK